MANLDLFGNAITYRTTCVSCRKDVLVNVEPPSKQLSFVVCKECRDTDKERRARHTYRSLLEGKKDATIT